MAVGLDVLPEDNGTLIFGAITAVTGAIGSLAGGWVIDYTRKWVVVEPQYHRGQDETRRGPKSLAAVSLKVAWFFTLLGSIFRCVSAADSLPF